MLQEGTTDRIHLISKIFYRALLQILYSNSVMANLRSHVVQDFVQFYFYILSTVQVLSQTTYVIQRLRFVKLTILSCPHNLILTNFNVRREIISQVYLEFCSYVIRKKLTDSIAGREGRGELLLGMFCWLNQLITSRPFLETEVIQRAR